MHTATIGAQQQLTGVRRQAVARDHLHFTAHQPQTKSDTLYSRTNNVTNRNEILLSTVSRVPNRCEVMGRHDFRAKKIWTLSGSHSIWENTSPYHAKNWPILTSHEPHTHYKQVYLHHISMSNKSHIFGQAHSHIQCRVIKGSLRLTSCPSLKIWVHNIKFLGISMHICWEPIQTQHSSRLTLQHSHQQTTAALATGIPTVNTQQTVPSTRTIEMCSHINRYTNQFSTKSAKHIRNTLSFTTKKASPQRKQQPCTPVFHCKRLNLFQYSCSSRPYIYLP